MAITEDAIREQLKNVIDPELFVNIVDLGLVYTINLSTRADGTTDVQIEMTMTSPMCPAGPQLVSGCKMALQQLDEVNEIDVKVVLDPPWSPDLMTEDARDELGIF